MIYLYDSHKYQIESLQKQSYCNKSVYILDIKLRRGQDLSRTDSIQYKNHDLKVFNLIIFT